MPTVRTYDDVDTLFKLVENGDRAIHKCVLGKTAYEEALTEGWTDISQLPKLPFPKALYRPNGSVLRVEDRTEMEQALMPCTPTCAPGCRSHNWETKPYAAPPVAPEFLPQPPAAVGSPAANAGTVELALQLVAANTRAADQDKAIDELRRQNAEILALLQAPKAAGKPGPKPKLKADGE